MDKFITGNSNDWSVNGGGGVKPLPAKKNAECSETDKCAKYFVKFLQG